LWRRYFDRPLLYRRFCEFVAPYDPEAYFIRYKMAPPTPIRIFDTTGKLRAPFIYHRDRDERPGNAAGHLY
jgi:hypothetical protein